MAEMYQMTLLKTNSSHAQAVSAMFGYKSLKVKPPMGAPLSSSANLAELKIFTVFFMHGGVDEVELYFSNKS